MSQRYCELRLDNNDNVKFIENNNVTQSQKEWTRIWTKRILTYSIINGTQDIPKNSKEFLALGIALVTWGAEVDLKFRRVKHTENPDIRIEFKTAVQEHRFEESPNVLAFAFMPGQGSASGIVVFNEEYLWSMDGKRIDGQRTWNVIHVMIHELGHTLGLLHDEHNDTSDVMDPFYNPNVLELSDWDILRIRQLYPIRNFKNWIRYSRLKNWLFHRKRRF